MKHFHQRVSITSISFVVHKIKKKYKKKKKKKKCENTVSESYSDVVLRYVNELMGEWLIVRCIFCSSKKKKKKKERYTKTINYIDKCTTKTDSIEKEIFFFFFLFLKINTSFVPERNARKIFTLRCCNV